jgi:hypothetical protein
MRPKQFYPTKIHISTWKPSRYFFSSFFLPLLVVRFVLFFHLIIPKTINYSKCSPFIKLFIDWGFIFVLLEVRACSESTFSKAAQWMVFFPLLYATNKFYFFYFLFFYFFINRTTLTYFIYLATYWVRSLEFTLSCLFSLKAFVTSLVTWFWLFSYFWTIGKTSSIRTF